VDRDGEIAHHLSGVARALQGSGPAKRVHYRANVRPGEAATLIYSETVVSAPRSYTKFCLLTRNSKRNIPIRGANRTDYIVFLKALPTNFSQLIIAEHAAAIFLITDAVYSADTVA